MHCVNTANLWKIRTSEFSPLLINLCVSLSVSCLNRPILMEKPDVVVGTPSRVFAHVNAQNLVLHSSLEMLVVDEADLVFSFGFEADLKNLLW